MIKRDYKNREKVEQYIKDKADLYGVDIDNEEFIRDLAYVMYHKDFDFVFYDELEAKKMIDMVKKKDKRYRKAKEGGLR